MKIFDNFSAKTRSEEQKMFFSLLYHDARNGQAIRFTKKGDVIAQYSTFDMDQLAYTGTDCNTYVTVNTFRGSRRTTDQLFNRTTMFVDLDCHSCESVAELEQIKKRTIQTLEKAFKYGDLAVPTMITSTGRGFGLFYVLKKSIANTNAAQSSMRLFSRTYDGLLDRFKAILQMAGSGLLEVDTKVRDAARVARMPGTVNLNNGKVCHLISVNYTDNGMPRYYDLKELISGCKLQGADSDAKRGKIVSFNAPHINPFLGMRVKRMRMLQELRGAACVGECREIMCFIIYSALTQINEHDKAVKLLYQFNAGFTTPLPESELEHIIVETDAHVVPEGRYAGQKGFYPYSDFTVIKTLDITDEEINQIGFGSSWQRQKKKEENQTKRKARNDGIADAITEYPDKTYAEIAQEYGVSVRTVERIARAYSVNRYNKNKANKEGEKENPVVCEGVSAPPEVVLEETETAKKCNESLGVTGGFCSFEGVLSFLRSCSWTLAADTLERLLTSTASLGRRDPCFHAAVTDYMHAQLRTYAGLSPAQVLSAVLTTTTTGLAILLNSYKHTHGLYPSPKNPPQRTTKVVPFSKHTVKDIRFDIIGETPEYQRRLDPSVLTMVRKAFEQIRYVRKDYFLLDGREIAVTDIKACYDQMTYKDIAVVTERIGRQCKRPKKPFFYILKTVWCYKHPEDAAHLEEKGTETPKGDFWCFEKREYSAEFFSELEKKLLT